MEAYVRACPGRRGIEQERRPDANEVDLRMFHELEGDMKLEQQDLLRENELKNRTALVLVDKGSVAQEDGLHESTYCDTAIHVISNPLDIFLLLLTSCSVSPRSNTTTPPKIFPSAQ